MFLTSGSIAPRIPTWRLLFRLSLIATSFLLRLYSSTTLLVAAAGESNITLMNQNLTNGNSTNSTDTGPGVISTLIDDISTSITDVEDEVVPKQASSIFSEIFTETPFVDPIVCNGSQLLFLLTVYAYVLYQGSELISSGSELLLLVPSMAELVGSVVLPVLGAVPDGVMVLVSGLGATAAKEIYVGVGTLAGSTVMLLTVAWFTSVLGGRVDLDHEGKPMYKKPMGWQGVVINNTVQVNVPAGSGGGAQQGSGNSNPPTNISASVAVAKTESGGPLGTTRTAIESEAEGGKGGAVSEAEPTVASAKSNTVVNYVTETTIIPTEWSKLIIANQGNLSFYQQLTKTGVGVRSGIKENCRFMLGTIIPLLFVQLFVIVIDIIASSDNLDDETTLDLQNKTCCVGFVGSFVGFIWYLKGQYENSSESDVVEAKQLSAIQSALRNEVLTLEGALSEIAKLDKQHNTYRNPAYYQQSGSHHHHHHHQQGPQFQGGIAIGGPQGLKEPLLDVPSAEVQQKQAELLYAKVSQLLRPYFKKYDNNGDGVIQFDEFRVICSEVSAGASLEAQKAIYQKMDIDGDGTLSYSEFVECMMLLARKAEEYDCAGVLADESSSSGTDGGSSSDSLISGSEDEAGHFLAKSIAQQYSSAQRQYQSSPTGPTSGGEAIIGNRTTVAAASSFPKTGRESEPIGSMGVGGRESMPLGGGIRITQSQQAMGGGGGGGGGESGTEDQGGPGSGGGGPGGPGGFNINVIKDNDGDDDDDSDNDDSEEETEEIPEELKDLSPEQQQFRIKMKSLYMLGAGCVLVVLFSDPMVDVLSEIADRCDINPFFISFVFSPLVSNASELIAAYNYASKKTVKTATIALSTLEGAACMNNTFVLGCFLFVISYSKLRWTFTIETMNIIIIEFIIIMLAWSKTVHTMLEATMILSLFIVLMIFTYVGTKVLGIS